MSDRVAVLDTDFLIKTYNTKNDNNTSLSDIVLQLDYDFCCHTQIINELKGDENPAALWLNKNLNAGKIKSYSDLDLVKLIQKSFQFGNYLSAVKIYSELLKSACDTFSSSFYERNYQALELLLDGRTDINEAQFNNAINLGDSSVGVHNNLGEIKSYLLTLVIGKCLGQQCFIFCSDDKQARRNIIADVNVQCISVFGFFWIAKRKNILTKKESLEFFNGWKSIHKGISNLTIKKQNGKGYDFIKMNVDDAFKNIWNDKFVLGVDGFLIDKSSK